MLTASGRLSRAATVGLNLAGREDIYAQTVCGDSALLYQYSFHHLYSHYSCCIYRIHETFYYQGRQLSQSPA